MPKLTIRRLMLTVLVVAIDARGIREIRGASPLSLLAGFVLFLVSAFVPVMVFDTILRR